MSHGQHRVTPALLVFHQILVLLRHPILSNPIRLKGLEQGAREIPIGLKRKVVGSDWRDPALKSLLPDGLADHGPTYSRSILCGGVTWKYEVVSGTTGRQLVMNRTRVRNLSGFSLGRGAGRDSKSAGVSTLNPLRGSGTRSVVVPRGWVSMLINRT